MNEMSKKQAGLGRAGIIIGAAVVVAVVAIFFILHAERKETIKIGAIIPFSGPAAHHADVMDAMLFAADEINSWGGINGRKIEFIIEDSKTNKEEGKKAFNRIEAIHHPVLYISTTSSVSMALAPLAEENEVVLVGLVVTTPAFTKQRKWVFRYFASAECDIPPILYILSDLKAKKLGMLYQNDEFGRSVFKLLKEEFEKIGGTVKSEPFKPKVFDYKGQIANLKDMGAIYAVGFESHLKNVFRQLREENFQGLILGSSGAAGPNVTSMPEANGAYVAAPIVYNPNYLFAKEAKEKYEAKYNKPFTQFAANGYDLLKLMSGLLMNKEISRESIKNLLEWGFMYHGVFGELDVKPGEHDITFPLHPAQIVDGKLKYLR